MAKKTKVVRIPEATFEQVRDVAKETNRTICGYVDRAVCRQIDRDVETGEIKHTTIKDCDND